LLAGHGGYRAIQALPGIGPVLAAVIAAEIGDISRFPGPGQLCSWVGLTPRHRESGTKVMRGHLTKQGSRLLRWALIEAIQRQPAGSKIGQAKDAIIARRGTQAPQHRQGRRGPATADPGLLRAAGRAGPLPGQAGPAA
jgi:transposase